jgi:cell division protein FtsB
MKNFRPHNPTSAEDDKALTLGSLYDRFCNRNQCTSCKFFNSMADCKILFAVQYMQKEIDQLKATNAALCDRVAELHDDLNTTAHNMTKEIEQCNK